MTDARHNHEEIEGEQASSVLPRHDMSGSEQRHDAEMFEEEEEILVESSNLKKRKKPRKRSKHWDPYDEVEVEEGDPPVKVVKGKCKQCFKLIAADSVKNGTSALRSHTIVCSRCQAERVNQTILNLKSSGDGDGVGSLTNWRFDQKAIRKRLCEMIILDELPFRFVEHEGFKKFVQEACPQFNIPCRKSVKEDCIRLFFENKDVLKSYFSKKNRGRLSVTTDCWTAINNTSYICVTAHFIGHDWNLNKKIISFRKISGHKGDDIAHSIIETLNEWELRTLFCCTMDNASANDKAIHYLRSSLENQNRIILGGKYLHLRCVAHIINLVVSDGLEEIGMSVRRVREAVKWIKSSPMRSDQFQNYVKALSIGCKRFLSLDVPTRWNSTYLMLEAAEPYEATFKLFQSVSSTFVADFNQKKFNDTPIGPPQEQDWINVRKMIKYLKRFYSLTCLFSGTNYVTSHLLFSEMCDLFELIIKLEANTDIEIASMASKMKAKLGKYFLEVDVLNPRINKILYIAAILDPRQKMKHVERCLKKVYGDVRGSELTKGVSDLLLEMFDHYKKMLTTTPSQSSTPSQPSASSQPSVTSRSLNEICFDDQGSCSVFGDTRNSSDDEDNDSDISELTIYLAEKFKDDSTLFDILAWWSKYGWRFPILSEMARDILAIPVSTVASESSFSTGGRVLDAFRSSLNPSTVEALICTKDWLRYSSTKNEEDQPEEEQEVEFLKMLSSMTTGV